MPLSPIPSSRGGSLTWGSVCDFQSRHADAPRFVGKGQGNCTWLIPDGTMRRPFSPTAAGKLAGGGRWILPSGTGSDDPPSKTRPPSDPPWFFAAIEREGAAHVHQTVHFFRPRFRGPVTRNAPFRYA
jgi:hypothetical protein